MTHLAFIVLRTLGIVVIGMAVMLAFTSCASTPRVCRVLLPSREEFCLVRGEWVRQ